LAEIKLLSAGIDVGAENIKVAILNGDRLLASVTMPANWDTKGSLRWAYNEALAKAKIEMKAVDHIGATGIGRDSVDMATTYVTDSVCSARGAQWLFPAARTVIDIGAEQSRVMNCNSAGQVLSYVRNENCAAGAGAFIEEIASALDLQVSEMSSLCFRSAKLITINSTCTVFAESEIISLLSEGAAKEDIAQAVCDAIAGKIASLVQSIKIEEEVVVTGGVAKNSSVVNLLSQKLNLDIKVAADPAEITAVGAALVAQQPGWQDKAIRGIKCHP
jgi:(R)-2-hydroxyacyl-CoA dehydratese activating ATPase